MIHYKLPLIAATALTLAVAGTLAYNVDTTKTVTNTVPILIQDKEASMPTNNEPSVPDQADIAPVGKAPDSVPAAPTDVPATAPTASSTEQPNPQLQTSYTAPDATIVNVPPATGLPTQDNPQILRNDDGKPVGTFFLAN